MQARGDVAKRATGVLSRVKLRAARSQGGLVLQSAVGDVLRALTWVGIGPSVRVEGRVGAAVWRSARRTAMSRRILACERLKSAARPCSEVEVTALPWPAVPRGGGTFQANWARPLR